MAAESAQGSQLLRGRNLLTAGLHGAPKQPRMRRRRRLKEGGCTRSGEEGAHGGTSVCGPRGAPSFHAAEKLEDVEIPGSPLIINLGPSAFPSTLIYDLKKKKSHLFFNPD